MFTRSVHVSMWRSGFPTFISTSSLLLSSNINFRTHLISPPILCSRIRLGLFRIFSHADFTDDADFFRNHQEKRKNSVSHQQNLPKSAKSQTEQVKICVICAICVPFIPRPHRSKKSVEIREICGNLSDVVSAQDRIGLIRLTSVRNPSKVV